MKFSTRITTTILLAVLLLFAGCTGHYVVTKELRESLRSESRCKIGEIAVALPEDTEPDALPPQADLVKFERWLGEEIDNKGTFVTLTGGEEPIYEVQGKIIDYNRGTGVARIFIGLGVGNARVVTELKLVDRRTGTVLFSGNFRRDVGNALESGDKVYRDIAKDFAKALDKQLKNVGKSENMSEIDESELE